MGVVVIIAIMLPRAMSHSEDNQLIRGGQRRRRRPRQGTGIREVEERIDCGRVCRATASSVDVGVGDM